MTDSLDVLRAGLLAPVALAFALGFVAALLRGDLRLPDEAYAALSMYLLLAIGLKGGANLAQSQLADVWRPALATLALGCAIPLLVYWTCRRLGRLDVPDAGALAAHYGSVSAVTFAASVAFVTAMGHTAEPFLTALLAILEIPAILIGLGLSRARLGKRTTTAAVLQEVLTGRSVLLLAGGLAIGWISGPAGMARVAPFFVAPFEGALCLFLLHLGTVAALRLRDLWSSGRARLGVPSVGAAGDAGSAAVERRQVAFVLAFAVVAPLAQGVAGTVLGAAAGLSVAGAAVLGAMAASASYIAAPAAVRMSLPEANPGLYLPAVLGVTFPLNLSVGIPLYFGLAGRLLAAG